MSKLKKKPNLHDAMRHPLRLAILTRMAKGEIVSPKILSDDMDDATVSTVAYHVRVLVSAGALKLVRTEPLRGSVEHFYKLIIKEPWALAALGV